MKEALLQIAWAHRLYTALDSRHTLEVIDPGTHNADAGPDFVNAKVRIDGILWAGCVEVHVDSQGWRVHRHDEDAGYTSVVLHVYLEGEQEVRDSQGRSIPSARLVLPRDLLSRAEQLTSHRGGCHHLPSLAPLVEQIDYGAWQHTLALERFAARAAHWVALLEHSQSDYVEVWHRLLMRYFGFGLNNDTMERLARLIPARAIIKQADNLIHLEALLLGQAGLLEGLSQVEDYVAELRREYAFLQTKYSLAPPLTSEAWHCLRTRPMSFPRRRLLQLAYLLHSSHLLSAQALEVKDEAELLALLGGKRQAHGFWRGVLGSRLAQLGLSAEACRSLGINVVSVYQLTMARVRPELSHLEGQALALLSSLPSEDNAIIRRFAARGLPSCNALESQALLELHKSYCQRRKCLYCPIGRILLKKQKD